MKYALVALLLLIDPLISSAQKHCLYADAGLSLAYFDPGFSTTYNYKFTRHIGVGGGIQGYVFHPAATNPRQFTPALFADWRFRIRPGRVNQYFIIWNIGWNFYKHKDGYSRDGNYVYTVPKDGGAYIGLGIGYFRRITKRGWGPYTTLKMINNFHNEDQLNIATGEQNTLTTDRATLVISFGFRFGDDSKPNPARTKRN